MVRRYSDWLAILAKIERNDPVALAELTQLIVGWLRRYRAQAYADSFDDIIQAVVLVVLDHYRNDKLRAPEAFVSFVGSVALNTLRTFARKQERSTPGDSDDAALDTRLRTDDARGSDPQVLSDLNKALESLPAQNRQVVEALYVRGETYAEASEALEIPLGTLKRLQTQGLAALRRAMGVVSESSAGTPGGRSPVPATRSDSAAGSTYRMNRAQPTIRPE